MVKEKLHIDTSNHHFDGYSFDTDGILKYQGHMYISSYVGLRKIVIEEMHSTHYSGHPRVTKMVDNMGPLYFWLGLKHNVTTFVDQFLEFQQLTVEHIHLVGLLYPHVYWSTNGKLFPWILFRVYP